MAKRLAVFVEGMTEQLFIQKLLIEVAGRQNISIDLVEARGKGAARMVTLRGHSVSNTVYYALVCDCGADNSVASDIGDNYAGLCNQGYELVLGLRDVHPEPDAKIPAIRSAIAKIMPTGTVLAHLVLAVREIEAWFLVEDGHYPAIHPNLNAALILEKLGLDTASVAAESIATPADTLNLAYQLQGRAYKKSKKHVQRTVEALDYARLNTELSARVAALGELYKHVTSFFGSGVPASSP